LFTLEWQTPFNSLASQITLSGEYTLSDGSYGFTWHELASVNNQARITYALWGGQSGDRFRFSVEYVALDGEVSWSCIGPYNPAAGQFGTLQGAARATLDGRPLAIQTAGDPTGLTTGCGLAVDLP